MIQNAMYRSFAYILVLLLGNWRPGAVAQAKKQGQYFYKKQYIATHLPLYDKTKGLLPSPVYDEDTLLVKTYWKAWKLAFDNFHAPSSENGFVSQFIDASFNKSTFQWDDCFMSMFCNYGYPLIPGISSLDNFYAKQHQDGEICRELVTSTGQDYWINQKHEPFFSRGGYGDGGPVSITYINRKPPFPPPLLTLDGMNHPIFAWAEWESYLLTGNKKRLSRIWEPLRRYYQSLKKYLRQGNGLYMTDWASMDNSPRNIWLKGGGTGIDISSEMVLFARNMADIGSVLGRYQEASQYRNDAGDLSAIINRLMWDDNIKFYVDLTLDGTPIRIKTVAGFWTLLAGIATPEQATFLVSQLKDSATFGRLNVVPTLAADEKEYASYGGYWRGAVWAPTNTMIIEGLEAYGYHQLAYEIAMKHLELVAQVYKKTGTIWENYSPDSITYGLHADKSPVARDFVGWSGIGPIMYLIKYAIGLDANAKNNEVTWTIRSSQREGCRNFRFNHHIITLIATPFTQQSRKRTRIEINSDGAFTLKILKAGYEKKIAVTKGYYKFTL